jgi:hypothetical protein
MGKETLGSQRLLQVAVNHKPELLLSALRRCGAVGCREPLTWLSPLAPSYTEFRDGAALSQLRLNGRLLTPLSEFWPSRGPVWDALALAAERPILLEAKAHIPEAASPPSQAKSATSAELIANSLARAKKHYGSRHPMPWGQIFYQYANRLAYQYFLRQLNGVSSSLVFLYFTNATDMDGPSTEQEWHGAIRLIHSVLGLSADLSQHGVNHAFIDARLLLDAA